MMWSFQVETQDYNGSISGVQKQRHWYREELELSHAQTATLHTKERWTWKKASYVLVKRLKKNGTQTHWIQT